jgi:aconitate hydratase
VSRAIERRRLVVCAVLSGNRNFEGRIHPDVRANYLMSPPLVVAYALAGRMDVDLVNEPLGRDRAGAPVYLRDLWPSPAEIERAVAEGVQAGMFAEVYADVYRGDETWRALPVPAGGAYHWDPGSTYVRRPPYFDGFDPEVVPEVGDITGARALAVLGDSVTTDHISPAGRIDPDSPAGRFLIAAGVPAAEFNSYGARRGNHDVMVRGTFASRRLRNALAPGTEGGVTTHLPSGEVMTIHAAATRYREERVPLVVLAGAEYGSGSSRDWAAKGARLLGVRAVLAESFERIHRSNLVGMGILPLQFPPGAGVAALGLTGREVFDLVGAAAALETGGPVRVVATGEGGRRREFTALLRVDSPQEVEYYRHGGILSYVLRHLLAGDRPRPVSAGLAAGASAGADQVLGDGAVEEASALSFPASDSPAY